MICQITIVITSPPIVAISAFSLRRGLAGALSAWPTSGFVQWPGAKRQRHEEAKPPAKNVYDDCARNGHGMVPIV